VPSWFWPALVAFVVFDLVVTALVLRKVAPRSLRVGGIDFARLRPLSDAMHERVGSYLRANYSGRPEQLPEVIDALLPELRALAREQDVDIDDETLKAALVVSVSSHGLANPREMREALAKVA
jgi:hypothetical protein